MKPCLLLLVTAPSMAFTPLLSSSRLCGRTSSATTVLRAASAKDATVAGAVLALSLSLATAASMMGGVGAVVGLPEPAFAARSSFEVVSENGIKYRLPPVLATGDRCAFVSSAMGQANAARDKIQDFRGCDMRGKSAEGFDLSGLVGSEADFTGVNFRGAQLSKGFLEKSKFDGADFTNGVVDRADFEGSSLKGTIFSNAVLASSSFKGADLTGADFSDAKLGDFDQKRLCQNPSLTGTNPTTGKDTRASAGCLGPSQ